MNNNKYDITCNCTDHTTKWILNNSFESDETLIFKQNSTNFSIENQKYISEVESLLEYFYKIKNTSINRKLVSTIFSNFNFSFAFYYYQDSLFDVSISLVDRRYSEEDIKREEKLTNLESPLNSIILSKSLEKGSLIKNLFSQILNIHSILTFISHFQQIHSPLID